jgi:hypothetical protein
MPRYVVRQLIDVNACNRACVGGDCLSHGHHVLSFHTMAVRHNKKPLTP